METQWSPGVLRCREIPRLLIADCLHDAVDVTIKSRSLDLENSQRNQKPFPQHVRVQGLRAQNVRRIPCRSFRARSYRKR